MRFGERALSLGIEFHLINVVSVLIFTPAKTMVGCFCFRKLVGLNVVLEELHNFVKSGKATPGEIVRYARDTRICSVLRF